MIVFPKVCVLVLNYNGAADSAECVTSLEKLNYPAYEILLIDNGSADISWKEIPKNHPSAQVLENGKNLGYDGGNNAGIRWALERGFDDVFILNNDTIVDPGVLLALERYSLENPSAGILGPQVLSYEQPQVIHSMGTSMDWFRLRPKKGLYGQQPLKAAAARDVKIIPGSALLLKNTLLKKVGLLNEKYFLIHEDADLCLRSLKAGYRNVVVPDAVIYHKESRSLSSLPFLSRYYAARNFLHLAAAHANLFQRLQTAMGAFLLFFKNLLVWTVQGFPKDTASKAFLTGVIDFLKGRTGKKIPS